MIGAIARARHDRSRSSAGYTLLEVVIGMSISAMILVPLTAWAILVLRQQPVQRDGMLRTASSGLLGSMFPSDVTVAGQASNSMTESWAVNDCAGGGSAGGSPQLVMVSAGGMIEKVVYSVAPSRRDAGAVSIWRRTCGVGENDSLRSEQELFRGVEAGSTRVTCSSRAGDDSCRRITLATTPLGSTRPLELSATRRINSERGGADTMGDPMPVAVIRLVSMEPRTPTSKMSAVFSAEGSTVGPGRTISYDWEFEPDVDASDDDPVVVAVFPSLAVGQENRDFTVRLTVADDLGRTNTTFLRVSSSNMDPVAVISRISPDPVEVGSTVTFNALAVDGRPGSYDPDGSIQRFVWLLTLPQVASADDAVGGDGPEGTGPAGDGSGTDGSGTDGAEAEAPAPREVWLTGDTATYTTREGDQGTATVRLTVIDQQLAQSTVSASFQISDPDDTPTTTTTTTTTAPPADGIFAAFETTVGLTSFERDFDASSTKGVGPDATYGWNFGDGSIGAGTTTSHTYPSAGTYPVTLTVTDTDGSASQVTRNVTISPGPLTAPVPRVSADGKFVVWDPVAQAERYLVNFRFSTPTDCEKEVSRQLVAATSSPYKTILLNPCTNLKARTEVQVGVVSAGRESWSGWIVVPTNNGTTTPTTPPTTPPVVK